MSPMIKDVIIGEIARVGAGGRMMEDNQRKASAYPAEALMLIPITELLMGRAAVDALDALRRFGSDTSLNH